MVWVDLSHKLLFQLMLTHTADYHVDDDVQAIKSTHTNIYVDTHARIHVDMFVQTFVQCIANGILN